MTLEEVKAMDMKQRKTLLAKVMGFESDGVKTSDGLPVFTNGIWFRDWHPFNLVDRDYEVLKWVRENVKDMAGRKAFCDALYQVISAPAAYERSYHNPLWYEPGNYATALLMIQTAERPT